MNRVRRWWSELWFGAVEPYNLAAARIIIGFASLHFLLGSAWIGVPIPRLSALASLDVGSRYSSLAASSIELYEPVSYIAVLGLRQPTQTQLSVAFVLGLVGSIGLVLGLLSRLASVITAGSLLYILGMSNSWGKINHSYNVLALLLTVLVFTRSGDAWSIDAALRRRGRDLKRFVREGAYAWPVVTMQLSWALMFFFAAWNKLQHSGLAWAFSENMRNTLVFQNYLVRDGDTASSLVRFAVDVDSPLLWYAIGAGALFGELLVVAAVFLPQRSLLRRLLIGAAFGTVVGLDVFMQLPNPNLLLLLLVFVNWDGVRVRVLDARRVNPSDDDSTSAAHGLPQQAR